MKMLKVNKLFFLLSSNQIDANEVLIPPSIEARRSAADVTEENDASVQQQQQQHKTASTPPIFILPEQQDSVDPDLLPATTTDETTVQNLEYVNNRQQHLDTANVNPDDAAASNSG